jgi:hypothetical protein
MHHDSFNADFYITAASVIPVLFLALTVQGELFDIMLTTMFKGYTGGRPVVGYAANLMLSVIVYAGVGEGFAIFGIYDRHADEWMDLIVLCSVFALLGLVIFGAVWRSSHTYVQDRRSRRESKGRSAEQPFTSNGDPKIQNASDS